MSNTVPTTPPRGAYVPRSHSTVAPARVPGSAPVPDLLGALASVLGVAVEDLPTGGSDHLADEPDVDPYAEPTWLE